MNAILRAILRIVGALLIIVGLFVTINTMDECAHEIAVRFIGIATTVVGVFVGGYTSREEEA